MSGELAKAERLAREVVLRKGDWAMDHESLGLVMAELDRLRRVEAAVRDLFEVMPMAARCYLAEHHGEVNRVWLALDATLSREGR
jgi:hypothetical protein